MHCMEWVATGKKVVGEYIKESYKGSVSLRYKHNTHISQCSVDRGLL